MRPLCTVCGNNFRAIAYHKYDRVYYRSRCDACIRRNKKIKKARPRWMLAGYQKKKQCDRCRFVARHTSQLMVYHVDGDLKNAEIGNLRTVCLNCAAEITRLDLPWRRGDPETGD